MITISPYWSESAIPVVFASDSNYIPYLSVAILSLIEHANDDCKYDIIILADEDSMKEEPKLRSMCEKRDNISIRCVDMTPFREYCTSFGVRGHLSVAAYYRLYISSICKEFSKILYMDCDVLCMVDVASLYHMDMGDCLVTAAYDKPIQYVDSEWLEGARAYIESLGMKDAKQCFNSGVLVMNLERMRCEHLEQKLLEVAAVNKKYWHDQSVLNICCQGRVNWVPEKWNFTLHMYNESELKSPGWQECRDIMHDRSYGIIHYAATQKPWKTFRSPLTEEWWKVAFRTPYKDEIVWRIASKLTTPLTPVSCLKLGVLSLLGAVFPSRYKGRLESRIDRISAERAKHAAWRHLWDECGRQDIG